MADPLAPVRRLDGPGLVAALNRRHGAGLRYLGPAGAGNVGAAHVRDRADRPLVLTWAPGTDVRRQRQIADLVEIARSRGVPAPRYERLLPVGDDVAVVQERLTGHAPDTASDGVVGQLLDLHDRLRGALAGCPDVPAAELHLRRSGPGFCLHESLAAYSDRTRAVLDWVRAVGARHPDTAAGDDLVHLDFQPANVLVDADRVTGIVDWDGACRGDGRLDLVVLYFGLRAPGRTVPDRLRRRVRDELPGGALRPYWAHLSLRMVDWAIRHYPPAEVEHWLTVAESGIEPR